MNSKGIVVPNNDLHLHGYNIAANKNKVISKYTVVV
jgi:hypothetical protein